MKPITNQQVVGGFNRKETWAFEWIYRDCKSLIFEVAAKILKSDQDAKDVTGDVFLKLFLITERVESVKAIRDKLYNYAKNLAQDRQRKKQKGQAVAANFALEQTEITEAEMYRYETAAALYYEIDRCKNKLSPQRQRIFDLYYIEQKSLEEISQELNISYKTVRNSKSIALKLMKLEIAPRKSFVYLLTLLS